MATNVANVRMRLHSFSHDDFFALEAAAVVIRSSHAAKLLVLMACLRAIPLQFFEAAVLDPASVGAGGWFMVVVGLFVVVEAIAGYQQLERMEDMQYRDKVPRYERH